MHIRKKNYLSPFHYSIFQDEEHLLGAELANMEKTKSFLTPVKNFVYNLLDKIPIISPNSLYKFIWNLFFMLITLAHFFVMVLNLTFEGNEDFSDFFHKWSLSQIFLISFDIFLKMNSGYFKRGFPIKNRNQILRRYYKKELLYDIVSLSALIYSLAIESMYPDAHNFHFLQLVYLVKYPIVETTLQNFEEIINVDEKIQACLSLLKLFIKLVFFSHFVACIWFFLGSKADSENWIYAKGYSDKSENFKYLISFYWAITTISTTGYGDITPQNEQEILFCLVVMMLGSIFFGYSLTYIGVVFDKLQIEETQKRYVFKFYWILHLN